MKGVLVAIMVVLAIAVLMVEPGQGINCEQVESSLSTCLGYLTGGGGGSPSSACCSGISSLKSLSTAERRAACECLKAAYSHYSGIKEDLAASLPKTCGVDVGVTITKDVKCSDIS